MSPRARRRARELHVPLQALDLPAEGKRISERQVLAAAAANRKVAATPEARALACRKGIVLHRAFPEGAHVEVQDVEALPALPLRLPANREPLSPARRAAAEQLAYVQRFVPQCSVDMLVLSSPLLQFQRRLQREWGKHDAPSVDSILLRALALLLAEETFRPFRGVVDGNDVVCRGEIAVGFAVPLSTGATVVPVVRAADRLPLKELAAAARDLAARARQKRLKPSAYLGAMMTLVHMGIPEVSCFRSTVRPGEAAVLAVPAEQPRPVWSVPGMSPAKLKGDALATIAPTWQLTLTVDQRLVDVALAADFLAALRTLVESPQRLL
ncbi:MAG: 2-oxo acid dehydrogenase subunit E2 [Planctomycetota bacterium]|nr:2-oxo acid dehydrogenase subunit E2 [Planctomycetota bacterium]